MVATARRALEEAPTRVWETRLGARRTASAKAERRGGERRSNADQSRRVQFFGLLGSIPSAL